MDSILLLQNHPVLIHLIIQTILFFLLLAFIGLAILIGIKVAMHLYLTSVDKRKEFWSSHLINYLYYRIPFEFDKLSTYDLIPLAKAMGELPEESSNHQKLSTLIAEINLDGHLARRYLKSRLFFRKIHYLSTLAELPASHIPNFYRNIIESTSNPLLIQHAIYAYSKTVRNAPAMNRFILFLLKYDTLAHIGRAYCRFLIYVALRHQEERDMEAFNQWLMDHPPEERMIRCVVESYGLVRRPVIPHLLKEIHRRFSPSEEIVAGVLRSLASCGSKECSLLEKDTLRPELPVRIACAKIGLDLCYPSFSTLRHLIRYFFDKNYYVRRNIFEACKRYHISKYDILSAAQMEMPDLLDDRFFNDMMRAYTFTR